MPISQGSRHFRKLKLCMVNNSDEKKLGVVGVHKLCLQCRKCQHRGVVGQKTPKNVST